MKVVKFQHGSVFGEGVVDGDHVKVANFFDVGEMYEAPFTLVGCALGEIEGKIGQVGAEIPLSDVKLLPPIKPSSKLICLGFNYKSHVEETNVGVGEAPALFSRWQDSVVGDGAPVWLPPESNTYDFEGEIAVVIGKSGRRIDPEKALDYAFGYTCFFDGSIREYQKHSPTAGKNFPHSGALGPWIMTADEAGDPNDFTLETKIDDEVMQSTRGELMIFAVEEVISYVSKFTQLSAGDVIATGTPGGVGAKQTPPRWLRPDEEVEITVSPIGRLKNKVIREA